MVLDQLLSSKTQLRLATAVDHLLSSNSLAKMAYTNNASGGAARGAGPPQVIFALESLMDMLAEKLGIDSLEFRKMNSMKPGQTRSTEAPIEQFPFPELCDDIKPHYERAKEDAAEFNKRDGKIKRGMGIACMSFGIAEAADQAQLSVEMNPDDTVTIYAAIAGIRNHCLNRLFSAISECGKFHDTG
jgi:aldehyde oxidoreductase